MNSFALSSAVAAGRPRRNRGASAGGLRPDVVKPVVLERGNVLRIYDGPGTRIAVASGALWVTEENSVHDHTLLPGEAVRLAHWGKALVFAHRRARVVIEVPAGVASPDRVEVAPAEGEPGRRIVLARRVPSAVSAMAAAVTRALRRAIRWLAARQGFAARYGFAARHGFAARKSTALPPVAR
jgi:hypothetical protein